MPRVFGNPGARPGLQRVKVIVEADGGSRGNPGPAGYGAVVWSADHGRVLAEAKASVGRATNNVAEYRGLIAGLEEAAAVGATEVTARLDSKLVVEQMSGRWRVKHPDLIPLREQALEAARAFDSVTYGWIPRAENAHADQLANAAMDAAAGEPAAASPEVVSSPAGWSGARGSADPLPAAAPRADRVVRRPPVFGPGESCAHRPGPTSGRRGGPVSGAPRRGRGRGVLPAAAGV